MQQIPLRFSFNAERSFDEFHPGSNSEALAHLRLLAIGTGESLIYLWGEAGQGKTHLLHACCREANRAAQSVSYLPLQALCDYGSDIFEDLEYQQLVCVDDLDVLAGRADWEQALFRLFNRLREMNHRLLVAAQRPPAELPIGLPDLKTRLGWGLTLMLRPLDDEDKLSALALHARNLGLELSPTVGRFLLSHYRRDLPGLRQLLEQLDLATLSAKRKLTIPFLKSYLEQSAP